MPRITYVAARYVLITIAKWLPRHIKRLIFWCALYSQMHGGCGYSGSSARALNARLTLTGDERAISIPWLFSIFIKDEVKTCVEIANDAEKDITKLDHHARRFSEAIPHCIKYSSRMKIARDFKQFFNAS